MTLVYASGGVSPLHRRHLIEGLVCTYSTASSVHITTGSCYSSSGLLLMRVTSPLTVTIDGTTLIGAAITAHTRLSVWLCQDVGSSTPYVRFARTSSATTFRLFVPAGTAIRRIGAVSLTNTALIRPYRISGDGLNQSVSWLGSHTASNGAVDSVKYGVNGTNTTGWIGYPNSRWFTLPGMTRFTTETYITDSGLCYYRFNGDSIQQGVHQFVLTRSFDAVPPATANFDSGSEPYLEFNLSSGSASVQLLASCIEVQRGVID